MTRQRGALIAQASQDFGLDHAARQAQSRIAFDDPSQSEEKEVSI
jgi:hypothetical protein